jgi:N-methylhydantoinase B
MFDSISLSILWSRLISIVDEAGTTLQRTSFSTVTRESADFAVVLMDTQGQSVAQSSVSVPSFLGVLPFLMKSLLKDYFPLDSWKEGDVVITNDPWLCAGHKPDIGIVSPIFMENLDDFGLRISDFSDTTLPTSETRHPKSLIGFIGCIAHSPDIGGVLWGAGARDFYEEGLYIPPTKLYTEGVANETLFRIIETNVRAATQTVGDIRAQVAANDQGIRSLLRMLAENNLTELDPLAEQIINASEKAMREAIRKAPNGTYHFDYDADGDAKANLVHFKIAVTIEDDAISVDYDGTSAAHPLAINAVLNYVFAYTAYPIKCVFSPEIPNNEGSFRPISVKAPEGSLLNAKKPSPLGARHITGNLLHAPVFGALAQAVPDRVQADCGGSVWIVVLSGKRDNGDEFVEYIFLAAGLGARPTLDGEPCLHFPTNVANVPIEVLENDCPVRVTRKQLAAGSGGDGEFRGGLGQIFSFKNIGTYPLSISISTEKTKTSAYGLFGGKSGKRGSAVLSTGRKLPAKGIDKLQPQEELILTLPGGGGYGKPSKRLKTAKMVDVALGYV